MSGIAVQVAGEVAVERPTTHSNTHFGRVSTSRWFIWSLVVVCGIAFLTSAWKSGDPVTSLTVVATTISIWLMFAWLRARSLAERDFFGLYCAARGFSYADRMVLLETTPLLSAGDRRVCEHYMEGPLASDMPGRRFGLSHYEYEHSEEVKDHRGAKVEARSVHKMTICVAEVPEAMTMFNGLYLLRRRGIVGRFTDDGWVNFDDLKPVDLESNALNGRYDIFAKSSIDRVNLLKLFKPSFQLWLAELPIEMYFEFSGGTLVVYRYKHELGEANLDAMVHGTGAITRRLLDAAA